MAPEMTPQAGERVSEGWSGFVAIPRQGDPGFGVALSGKMPEPNDGVQPE